MLARTHRLRASSDIARVYTKGNFGGAANLYAKSRQTHGPHTRVAVVVSKKVSKKAVVRNRNRRRLHGTIEALWQTVRPGYDIVVTVTADTTDLKSAELSGQVRQVLDKCGLIQKP